jgi:putative oxidoreductase
MQRSTASTAAGDLLRIGLGIMYVAHSVVLKVATYGFDGTAQYFESIGLPGALAYVTIVAEALGGAFLIAGYKARETALLLVPILAGALWAHASNGWVFSNAGGGWEYPLFLIVISLAVALNPGRVLAPRAPRTAPRPAELAR